MDDWDDDWDDLDDDSLNESDYPDEADYEDDFDDAWGTFDEVPCPHCGADIADDAVRCPVCGDYVTFDTSPWQGKQWWWIAVGLLGVAATILALALG